MDFTDTDSKATEGINRIRYRNTENSHFKNEIIWIIKKRYNH